MYADGFMSPMQRCFSDLVCQPLMTSYVIDAYLCMFGHVVRLDSGVPAHDALRLTVAIRRQKGSSQLEKTAGSPLQRLAQQAVRVATQYVSALSSPVGAQGPYAADPSRRNVSTCSFPRRTRSHAHRCSRLTL